MKKLLFGLLLAVALYAWLNPRIDEVQPFDLTDCYSGGAVKYYTFSFGHKPLLQFGIWK